ncbi:MAG: protein-L-isoaspartate(D-aspartate) O-methyltransferase [Methylococcaceae bacterium]
MDLRLQGSGMTSPRTRERMVGRIRELGVGDDAVLAAMLEIPRHIFVEEALASRAYDDTALPIGFNQTISQPYIVALMTHLLLERGLPDKVLEVGTGSGYQTAVLSRLIPKVYSVERILPLQQRAKACLSLLNIRNVRLKHSDGCWGWKDYAPYPAILVTAAPAEIPETLLEQLSPGGVMVIPVGEGRAQTLQRVSHSETGFHIESIAPVTFVPLVSGLPV